MPNSITIVSPVSGETILASAVMGVSIDYEYIYGSNAYIGAACSAPALHSGIDGPISGSKADSAEVGLGTHTATYTGVEVTARIQTGYWGSSFYCQTSVNNITISNEPPVLVDPPETFAPSPSPFFRLGEAGAANFLDGDQPDNLWRLDFGRQYDRVADAPKRDREYNPEVDLKLTGKIKAGFTDGSLVAVVSGKLGKTGLIHVHTVPQADIAIDSKLGTWELTIPKKVLKKKNAPRLVVVTLLDKDEEAVSVASASLIKKTPPVPAASRGAGRAAKTGTPPKKKKA